MKTYKHLWDDFISDYNIRLAIHNASLGKKKKTRKKLKMMDSNPDKYISSIREYACHYYNHDHTPITIYDGISRKERTIIVPTPEEQVVHHMVVNILKPIFMKSMYQHSYGSIPNRGAFGGKKQLEKWLPRKYVLKMDIKKYFDSISQEILLLKLEKKIKDERFIGILKTIIGVVPNGIPLGFYTSQWFANFYLTDFDHYVSSELGYGKYIRLMDDMVILGDDKSDLHRAKDLVEIYLNHELSLELKSNWQVFKFDTHEEGKRIGRSIDFMGFQFFKDKVTLRKSIFIKSLRKARKIWNKEKLNWYDASQMLSYCGWYKATDTYRCFQRYIKPIVDIRRLRHIVSNHSKKLAVV